MFINPLQSPHIIHLHRIHPQSSLPSAQRSQLTKMPSTSLLNDTPLLKVKFINGANFACSDTLFDGEMVHEVQYSKHTDTTGTQTPSIRVEEGDDIPTFIKGYTAKGNGQASTRNQVDDEISVATSQGTACFSLKQQSRYLRPGETVEETHRSKTWITDFLPEGPQTRELSYSVSLVSLLAKSSLTVYAP